MSAQTREVFNLQQQYGACKKTLSDQLQTIKNMTVSSEEESPRLKDIEDPVNIGVIANLDDFMLQ